MGKNRPLWRLEDLMVQSFEPEELRRSLTRYFPAISAELPATEGSPAQFAHQVVGLLDRHGLVSSPLFIHLLRERPLRRAQFLSAAQALVIDVSGRAEQAGDDEVTRVFQAAHLSDVALVDNLEKLLLERERHAADDPRLPGLTADIEGLAAQVRARRVPKPGAKVAGTILEYPIDRGSCGTIWRAHDVVSGVARAVKVFDLNRLTDGIMLWRFRRSIRALQTLNRSRGAPPSIARISAVSADGLAFSMPLYTSGSLVRISRYNWSLDAKIAMFCELCRAVAFTHRFGVIHRDIQPANVLMDDDGRPVLIDFDVADISFLTQQKATRGGLGTILFAAPEQLVSAGEVDERADIYSLGRLLHFLLIERPPAPNGNPDEVLANLASFPPSLADVVRKATRREPADRHGSVVQLLREVVGYKTGWSAFHAKLRRAGRRIVRNAALLMFSFGGMAGSSIYAVQQRALQEKDAELLAQSQRANNDLARLTGELGAAQLEHARLKEELLSAQDALEKVTRRARPGCYELVDQRRAQQLSEQIAGINEGLAATERRLMSLYVALADESMPSQFARGGYAALREAELQRRAVERILTTTAPVEEVGTPGSAESKPTEISSPGAKERHKRRSAKPARRSLKVKPARATTPAVQTKARHAELSQAERDYEKRDVPARRPAIVDRAGTHATTRR